MNKIYVIHWKSRSNGRIGTGTTRFDRDEADRLVQELNRDYPEIEHLALNIEGNGEGAETIPIPLVHATSE
jgi:hypothetical protein